jgi:hypothetical protein
MRRSSPSSGREGPVGAPCFSVAERFPLPSIGLNRLRKNSAPHRKATPQGLKSLRENAQDWRPGIFSAVPGGTFSGSHANPGLRPGLLSAVPTGLGLSVEFSCSLFSRALIQSRSFSAACLAPASLSPFWRRPFGPCADFLESAEMRQEKSVPQRYEGRRVLRMCVRAEAAAERLVERRARLQPCRLEPRPTRALQGAEKLMFSC